MIEGRLRQAKSERETHGLMANRFLEMHRPEKCLLCADLPQNMSVISVLIWLSDSFDGHEKTTEYSVGSIWPNDAG